MQERTSYIRRSGLYFLVALTCVFVTSCVSTFFTTTPGEQAMAFRIENATAGAVEVVIQVMDANGNPIDTTATTTTVDIPVVTVSETDVSFSTLTPIGAAAAASSEQPESADGQEVSSVLGSQATIRVPGFSTSEGILVCGAIIKVTATTDGTEDGAGTQILFDGAGTGTPGFDQGSVGQSGERFLLESLDFTCGESVVIRIGDDGTATSTSAGSNATGKLAVVAAGEPSPFDPIEAPGSSTSTESTSTEGGDSGTNGETQETGPTTVLIQIENHATIIADINMVVGTAAGEQTFAVSVPPNMATEGEFMCGTQFTFPATFPNTDRPPSQEPDSEFPDAIIILTGDGTGSPGFDEASVSRSEEHTSELQSH